MDCIAILRVCQTVWRSSQGTELQASKIGVKTEKITILEDIKDCKPLILLGLQKNIKNISAHLLTVIIISVIT